MLNPWQTPQFGIPNYFPVQPPSPAAPSPTLLTPQQASSQPAEPDFSTRFQRFTNAVIMDPFFQMGLAILGESGQGGPLASVARGASRGLSTVETLKRNKLENDLRLMELRNRANPQNVVKPTTAMQNFMAAGLEPGSPEFEAAMMRYMVRPTGTTVNVGTGGGVPMDMLQQRALQHDPTFGGFVDPEKPEKGYYSFTPSGVEVKHWAGTAGAKTTEAEKKAAGRYQRGAEILKEYNSLPPVGTSPADWANLVARQLPAGGITRALANLTLPQVEQRRTVLEEQFITDYVRDESGAAVRKDEMPAAREILFPQPGQSPEVHETKARIRQQILQGQKVRAGGVTLNPSGLTAPIKPVQPSPPLSSTPTPQTPRVTPGLRSELEMILGN